MDFDLELVTAPFRMQPGLRRLGPGARHLSPLAPGSALEREKRLVVDAGASRLTVPGFDEGPALAAIARQAAEEGIDPRGLPPELAFEEDFAVLEGEGGTLPWLRVCVPSHWAPEDKLGLPFGAVHAPVADGDLLRSAGAHLVRLATSGERWERHVWTITPSARFDQHPRRHSREPWADTSDPGALARACHFRAERQTFFPVGQGLPQAVFTIRVMLAPLADVFRQPADRARLRESLASMSETVLAYKGLAPAREPLLRWLEGAR